MLSKVSRATVSIMGVGALAVFANINLSTAFADNPDPADANFQVNVTEALSVSVTVPEDWASGSVGDLLRNKISLSVSSNNPNGFTASMTTKTNDTSLVHDSIQTTTGNTTIPTLSSNWTRTDTSTTNFWGYSINDDEQAGTYSPLVGLGGTPIQLITRTESIDPTNPVTSRDIYFGAKADATKIAGTYSNTVVISVVSGMISPEDNPITPDNPIIPASEPNESDQVAYNTAPTGGSSNGTTSYTYRSSGSDGGVATNTTTTNINDGDVRSSYKDPAGVKRSSESNIADNSMLTTALAVTAGVAAGAGVLFFILAKRKKDDEEEK